MPVEIPAGLREGEAFVAAMPDGTREEMRVGGAEVSPERTFAPAARRSARGASGALHIAEGARTRSSPTAPTRDTS